MMTPLCTRVLALILLGPTAAPTPFSITPRTQGLSPADVAAMQARLDPSLESQRAGRAERPAPLGALELAELSTAQQNRASLAAMRAGFAPSNSEWTWIAIGAGIVLLLVLI